MVIQQKVDTSNKCVCTYVFGNVAKGTLPEWKIHAVPTNGHNSTNTL